GRAHDRVLEVLGDWRSLIRQCLDEARTHQEIDRKADLEQAVFEVQGMLTAANFLFVMTNDPMPLRHARKGVQNVLDRLPARWATKKQRTRHEARTSADPSTRGSAPRMIANSSHCGAKPRGAWRMDLNPVTCRSSHSSGELSAAWV